jgi:hypothetical protein
MVTILVRKPTTTISPTSLLLLLLLLHAIVVHTRGPTRVAISTPVAIAHAVGPRTIPPNVRVGLVAVPIPSRTMGVLVVATVPTVSTASTSLLVASATATLVAVPHVTTTPAGPTRPTPVIVVARGSIPPGCTLVSTSHQTLAAVELMPTLGSRRRKRRLLPIGTIRGLHCAISWVAHLVKLAGVKVGVCRAGLVLH